MTGNQPDKWEGKHWQSPVNTFNSLCSMIDYVYTLYTLTAADVWSSKYIIYTGEVLNHSVKNTQASQPARVPTWFHSISSRPRSTQLSGESVMVWSVAGVSRGEDFLYLTGVRCLGPSARKQVRAWAPTSPASRGRWLWGGAICVCLPECVCVCA